MNKLLMPVLALMVALIAACGGGSSAGISSGNGSDNTTPSVQIDAAQSQAVSVVLGEQLDDYVAFDDVHGGTFLNAVGARWLRIHAGADNDVLPEVRPLNGRASWNFSALDRLVSIAYEASLIPLLNVRTAPVSVSTCTSFHSGTGYLNDASFGEFADYVGNLVLYFNRGVFTDSSGVLHVNPHGTSHRIDYLELWNEPDLPYEFPCLKQNGSPSLSPAEYLAMWEVTTRTVSTIDPSIRFAGPAVSDPRNLYYLRAISGAQHKADIVSVHGYAGPNSAQNIDLLKGGNGAIGIDGIQLAISDLQKYLDSSGQLGTPIYIDEFNVSPDGTDDPLRRGWNGFGVALGSRLFAGMATASNSHPIGFFPFQFVEASGQRLTSISSSTGIPLLPYWRDVLLARVIHQGDRALHVTTVGNDAALGAFSRSDGSGISVLVPNLITSGTGQGAVAALTALTVEVKNNAGRVPSSVKTWVLDDSTNLSSGPVARSLDPKAPLVITFTGHGMALLELTY
jgi:hypothetical protein